MREIRSRGFHTCDGPDTIVVDGEPVYAPETNCWALVTQNAFCPMLTFPDGEKCSVYDWCEQVGPVYRRPPGGEEDK